MITALVRMNVLPGKKNEVLQTLRYMARIFRTNKECKAFGIYQDLEDGSGIVQYSTWRSRVALETYVQSEHFEILTGMGKTLCVSMETSFLIPFDGVGT